MLKFLGIHDRAGLVRVEGYRDVAYRKGLLFMAFTWLLCAKSVSKERHWLSGYAHLSFLGWMVQTSAEAGMFRLQTSLPR